MNWNHSMYCMVGAGIAFMALSGGCTTVSRRPDPPAPPTHERTPTILGRPLTVDWEAACRVMAEDLTMASVFQNATRPQVVEIKPIENSTGVALDTKIYPRTIRGIINEAQNPMLVFRDETGRREIIEERINQSDTPLAGTRNLAGSRSGKRSRNGPAGDGEWLEDEGSAEGYEVDGPVEVPGQVGTVDFFLKGLVYADNARLAISPNYGDRDYQFQFWLTDVRTDMIVWERIYRVGRTGTLSPIPP